MGEAPMDVQEIDTGGHRLVVGADALMSLGRCLNDHAAHCTPFILGDDHTLHYCLPRLLGQVPALRGAAVIAIPPGEASKSIAVCQDIWRHLGELEADRHSVLVNLGGGVVSDLGGFIAGTYKRGIRFLNVPTSLMGMVDASIGSKSGVDLGGVKNMVGLFNDPLGVFVHVPFLKSLGKRELLNGVAEMIKHGLVRDASHWEAIRNASLHDLQHLTPLVHRSASIKADVVHEDPREQHTRKLLNFGHSIGHALESLSWEGQQQALLHGEAIAIGMICASWISWQLELLDRDSHEKIIGQLLELYKPYRLYDEDFHRILVLMRNDKKNADGRFRFTVLTGIGSARPDVPIAAAQVQAALEYYRLLVESRH